jgi:hypothetical protein
MRSLAVQSVEELGGRWSILHRQKRDPLKLEPLPPLRRGERPETHVSPEGSR